MRIHNRALMIVEWEGDSHTPNLEVKVTAIPDDLTIIVELDGEAEGVMQYGDLQDAVMEAVGDLL